MDAETPSMNARVAVYVGEYRLEGDLYVGTEVGGRPRRVSDALNGDTPFIVLTDVNITDTNSITEEVGHYNTIFIRKGEIKFAIPLD